ncbi:uncharacterized protein LOC117328413 [Pecten maximus]|uniref:uncharacterized protein LOC117328413 n=1 Tax=Pecten maximus TaxID=6579 RepID=UPI0014589A5C|nr:uncharacterized protein LOC117328413 [Pecten maximus]
MAKILHDGHAEIAPQLQDDEECWYLPRFGIYHPKKPEKIRGVFDSSARCDGTSLNSVLLTGPDLVNSLLGVLLRFRTKPVAITGDIEQMFYCFKVHKSHRNFLRFFWYEGNDTTNQLIEYRMTAHVLEMRRHLQLQLTVSGKQLKEQTLISAVLEAVSPDDLAGDIVSLDLNVDSPPRQRSLGLFWNLTGDFFTFNSDLDDKPYTRRGILGTVNGLYDPLGFAAPVILEGKLLFRDLISSPVDWDDPLPEVRRCDWELWNKSLKELNDCQVPRPYCETGLHEGSMRQVHLFCDASKDAIAAVAYFRIAEEEGRPQVSFILGKAKVAPMHGHTIPRLELCAAVLATEPGRIITDQLDVDPSDIYYHSDSNVVLGYIHNRVRRFHTYVTNRVDRILNVSEPTQWKHVPTDLHPADFGTRCIPARQLSGSQWLKGPSFLLDCEFLTEQEFPLVTPQTDAEVRAVVTLKSLTCANNISLCSDRFERFSNWTCLTRAIGNLLSRAQRIKTREGNVDPKKGSVESKLIQNHSKRSLPQRDSELTGFQTCPSRQPNLRYFALSGL